MATTILGEYDSELVVVTLSGEKSGDELQPTQFGPDTRYDGAARTHSSTTEGQGGAVIRNIFHPSASTFTLSLMSTDPVCEKLSQHLKIKERYKLDVVDNNGTGYVSGRCWVQEEPGWKRGKEAIPQDWVFGVVYDDINHGQTAIV